MSHTYTKSGAQILSEYRDQNLTSSTLSLEEMIDAEISKVEQQRDALLAESKRVIQLIHGEVPIQGWLPDTDTSRTALDLLRSCVAAIESPTKEQPA